MGGPQLRDNYLAMLAAEVEQFEELVTTTRRLFSELEQLRGVECQQIIDRAQTIFISLNGGKRGGRKLKGRKRKSNLLQPRTQLRIQKRPAPPNLRPFESTLTDIQSQREALRTSISHTKLQNLAAALGIFTATFLGSLLCFIPVVGPILGTAAVGGSITGLTALENERRNENNREIVRKIEAVREEVARRAGELRRVNLNLERLFKRTKRMVEGIKEEVRKMGRPTGRRRPDGARTLALANELEALHQLLEENVIPETS